MNTLYDSVIKERMWNSGMESPGLSHFLKHHVCDYEIKQI